jgi:hypothetical protein
MKFINIIMLCSLAGCINMRVPTNYDKYIGTNFDTRFSRNSLEVILEDDKKIIYTAEKGGIYKGCIETFTVDKKNKTLIAWSVSPSPEACPMRRWPLGT